MTLSPFQLQLQGGIRQALDLPGCGIKPDYSVYDDALGNNAGLQWVKQTGRRLISKLRHNPNLYFPYTGAYSGKGKPKKYGEKLTLEGLTHAHLCSETVENNIQTRVYQIQAWHKNFLDLLDVVAIVKTNLTTGRPAKALLFSDGLDLACGKLIGYYRLRFQIEFNFRDAKQYWGLEDFMDIKETQVSNTANFSLFMVTFSQLLLPATLNGDGMQDLKTTFRAQKCTHQILTCWA